ncbi:ets DNA-binding protein pokkuri [Eurytemora carolleeae]|uniref:ets DNA-binding protein pokkuri n=1 Tax=Eurytemora carolleeae TaxID=1294199 RepID=UPI000C77FB0A|nr:ets DNA-binding protein pokkuri [Eurytemora carolleeae]|eukprot:XP_023346507.1 ets DNA-binding protein pokkuri-like [Eurytemora affinis]
MSRDLYQVHPTRQEIQQSWQELETTGRDNIIQDLDMPWYTKPAVILGKLYPEISIKKIYSEETLPPYLPKEPRRWSREEVNTWIEYTLESHNLPIPPLHRFSMNGKGLSLMSVEMFSERVPLGGKLLYKDFKIRLAGSGYS